MQVTFSRQGCQIRSKNGSIIAEGTLERNLYKLNETIPGGNISEQIAVVTADDKEADTWHKRLKHLDHRGVQLSKLEY